MRHRTRWILGVAVVAAIATSGMRANAQASDRPNPYRSIEGWVKLPDERKWGQTISIDVDLDGKSIWVFERCGGTTCDGSDVAPILKIDASGNVVKSFGVQMQSTLIVFKGTAEQGRSVGDTKEASIAALLDKSL